LGGKGPVESRHAALRPLGVGEAVTRYQVQVRVEDRPGVLAQAAQVFADHGVSIETVRQARADGEQADLLVVTHAARDEALAATVAALADLAVVRDVVSVLRVEGA
ncbi:MAG: ACT domain-containing protein, partial [Actinotalea sp.]|nr:ACT domain-containing protein [Actinotalea sp.]